MLNLRGGGIPAQMGKPRGSAGCGSGIAFQGVLLESHRKACSYGCLGCLGLQGDRRPLLRWDEQRGQAAERLVWFCFGAVASAPGPVVGGADFRWYVAPRVHWTVRL